MQVVTVGNEAEWCASLELNYSAAGPKILCGIFFLVDLTTQAAPRHYMGRWHSEPPIAFKTLVHSIVIVII